MVKLSHSPMRGHRLSFLWSGSLRRQLLTVFCIALLIFLFASVAGIFLLVNKTERDGWEGRQKEATQRVAQTVADFLDRQQNLLQLLDLFGRKVGKSDPAALDKLLRSQPALMELVYLSTGGQVIAHAPKDKSVLGNLFTIPQSNWFLVARNGESYIGDIQVSAGDEPYLIYAAPADGKNVVAVRLRMNVLNEVIASLHFGDTGIAYLVNQSGRVIAHSDPKVVSAHSRLDDQLLTTIRTIKNLWVGGYHNFEGARVVGAMVPIPGTPWVAVTEVPRVEAHVASRRALKLISVVAIFLSTFLIAAVLFILERQFLQPMRRLQEGVLQIGKGDLDHRIALPFPGEISRVAGAFDEMASRLKERERQVEAQTAALLEAKATLEQRVLERTRELQDQVLAKEHAMAELAAAQGFLLDMSRAAGMAEVATGVLHNVGNVLNSINVSCQLILERLQQSRVVKVSKAAALMAKAEGGLSRFLTEDPRGRMIPEYLASLAPVLEEERRFLINETESLRDRIDHIKEIVVMQQNYGHIFGIDESITPEQLMEDALRLNSGALVRHEISVKREYKSLPPIFVDKHKVLQILLNLINNAMHACTETDNENKTITLRLFSRDRERLCMQVSDNGMGIPPENLTRIFQHGFTTHKTGHGFGLHSGALAAHELGGSLRVHSDGAGAGATFTLEWPFKPGEQS
jgi:signal transduction histidine kinase